jgi:hypothetical protein
MDYNEIRNLIERYWQCETDKEEEKIIAGYYKQNSNLPEDLEKWREWFTGLQGISELPDVEFDKKILQVIDGKRKKISFSRTNTFYRISIAASVALLVFIGLKQGFPTEKNNNELTDEEMVMTVKTLLLFTSSEMNSAQTTAKDQLKTANIMNEIINISYYD